LSKWRSSYPFDWDFRSCPPEELPILYNYEFSRESAWVRRQVEFIRYGHVMPPTYWSPNPAFGWREWPTQNYLSIPEVERLRRLYGLLSGHEQFVALLRPPTILAPATREGRASFAARYSDQLRALSIARLRTDWTAVETFALLREIYAKRVPYSDVTAMERAQRKAHRFLVSFVLRAEERIKEGLWFPPFGGYVIRP
jgi:hypothetical protein